MDRFERSAPQRRAAKRDARRGLTANSPAIARRAIDFRHGDKINEKAFKALIGEAVALNTAKNAAKKMKKPAPAKQAVKTAVKASKAAKSRRRS